MTQNSRITVVTGAAGALGQAVVRLLAAQGHRVACLDRDEARLQALFGQSGQLLAACDVTSDQSMADTLAALTLGGEHVDVLVHVAGGFEMGEAAHALTRESWDRMMNLNAWAFVAVTRAVIPNMLRHGGGKVIAVSAAAAARGAAQKAAYVASKSALQRLVESLSAEVRAQGVSVNSVAPTTMDTPANRQAMPDADRSAWVTLESAAQTIAALASPAGDVVHGQHVQLGA
jgi:NAD(P)-dependent dehydrogenase (short-subunit alcohol dehydrogenase family)